MERIVIETTEEIKKQLKDKSYQEEKTMKELLSEAIEYILKRKLK
jgi:hypothetical protein